jgi:hypothetical protein
VDCETKEKAKTDLEAALLISQNNSVYNFELSTNPDDMNTLTNEVEVDGIKFTVKPAKIDIQIYRAAIKLLLKRIPAEKLPKTGTEIDVTAWLERG